MKATYVFDPKLERTPCIKILSLLLIIICGSYFVAEHGLMNWLTSYGSEYLGIAPGCNLVVLKILDSKGNTSVPVFLEAIEWLANNYQTYQIQIVNISIGANTSLSYLDSHLLIQAVERLWDLGMTVCTSAGNNGPSPGSITSPGTSCKVITVGASDDERSGSGYQQGYSGRGPIACFGLKPEVVAPGNQIISCSNSLYGYSVKTGTSMSTALVSGAIALLSERSPAMSNEEIKLQVRNSTRRLNLPHFQQGYGLLDIERLLADTRA